MAAGHTPPHDDASDSTADAKPPSMVEADTANGENLDDDAAHTTDPAPLQGEESSQHRTGERQARENAENDPPA